MEQEEIRLKMIRQLASSPLSASASATATATATGQWRTILQVDTHLKVHRCNLWLTCCRPAYLSAGQQIIAHERIKMNDDDAGQLQSPCPASRSVVLTFKCTQHLAQQRRPIHIVASGRQLVSFASLLFSFLFFSNLRLTNLAAATDRTSD